MDISSSCISVVSVGFAYLSIYLSVKINGLFKHENAGVVNSINCLLTFSSDIQIRTSLTRYFLVSVLMYVNLTHSHTRVYRKRH